MDPGPIRYSQHGISTSFTGSTEPITDATRRLQADPDAVIDVPPIKVVALGDRGQYLVSLDNRRLWMFKHAGVTRCPVIWATEFEVRNSAHFDTEFGSEFIALRGARFLDMTDLTRVRLPPDFVPTGNNWPSDYV
jgi:hypothetical protein